MEEEGAMQNKLKYLTEANGVLNFFLCVWGFLGIALLYLQLHRVTEEESYLQRSLDYVKRILRNLNGRRLTFLCGDAGPLAVGAVVYHKLKNDGESKECVTK